MKLGDPYYDIFRQADEVRHATRQFDEIRRVTQQFDEVRRATQPDESLRQMTRVYEELRQAAQPWDRLRELTNPVAEVARAIETTDLCKAFGSSQTDAIEAASKVASTTVLTSLASSRELLEAQRESWNVTSVAREIQKAAEAWHVKTAGALDQDLSRWITRYTSSLISTERLIVDGLGTDYKRAVGFSLEELVGPTLDAYSALRLPLGAGLLAGTSEASLLTWPAAPERRSPFPPLTSGFLRRTPQDDRASRVIEIHCQLHCRFCGEPIIVDKEDRYLDSEGRMIINLEIVPLCPTCLRLQNEDPEYFMRQLDRVQGRGVPRPRLTLIRGAAEATSAPRGKEVLWLVNTDEGTE